MLKNKQFNASFTLTVPSRNPVTAQEAFIVFQEMGNINESIEYFVIFFDNEWRLYALTN